MRIGFDFDGVINNFEELLYAYAELFDVTEADTPTLNKNIAYAYSDIYNWTENDKNKFLSNYLYQAHDNCFVRPCAKSILDIIHKNHEIIIITARGSKNNTLAESVKPWLESYMIPYDILVTAAEEKNRICASMKIDLYVDDSPFICNSIEKETQAVLFSTTYNQVVKLNHNVKLINYFPELLRYL